MKLDFNPIVINITSISAYQIFNCSSAYTISKHSESVMSKILRRDLAQKGIRLTEIVPGTVNSYEDPNNQISISTNDVSDLIEFILNTDGNVNINTVFLSHTKEVPFLS